MTYQPILLATNFNYYAPYPIFTNLDIHLLISRSTLCHPTISHISNTHCMMHMQNKIRMETSLVNTCLLHQGTDWCTFSSMKKQLNYMNISISFLEEIHHWITVKKLIKNLSMKQYQKKTQAVFPANFSKSTCSLWTSGSWLGGLFESSKQRTEDIWNIWRTAHIRRGNSMEVPWRL